MNVKVNFRSKLLKEYPTITALCNQLQTFGPEDAVDSLVVDNGSVLQKIIIITLIFHDTLDLELETQ